MPSAEIVIWATKGEGVVTLRGRRSSFLMFVDGDAPQIDRAATTADEIEMSAVGRPHGFQFRAPSVVTAIGFAPQAIDGPDIQSRTARNRASRCVGNPLPMRRPAWQHGVDISELPFSPDATLTTHNELSPSVFCGSSRRSRW